MTEKSKSHFLKIFSASFSFPVFKTINILSWLSDSIISYGDMPVSRHGTLFKFNSIPIFPFEAISTEDEVKPAAPISWMDTIVSVCINSRQASNKSFSAKGSPTCTVGFFASESESNSCEAMDAP